MSYFEPKKGIEERFFLVGVTLPRQSFAFGEQTLGIYESMREGHDSIDAKKAEAAGKGASEEDLAKFDAAKKDMAVKLEELKPEVEKVRANLALLEKHGLLED